MDYANMASDALEARRQEIAAESTEDRTLEELTSLEAEMRAITDELETRKAAEEERKRLAESIATDTKIEPTNEVEPEIRKEQEKKDMFGPDSIEYRNAFMANLVGNATIEQRAILADNTTYGDGLALPTALDREIWDQINNDHPILRDVDILRSGIAIKVTRMTPSAVAKKKDSDPSTEQTFTSAEVVLVGADYHTYVELSYAEAKMSQGAMERFLVREVADALGSALAGDTFAEIIAAAGVGQKVTKTGDNFADLKTALGLASAAGRCTVYAPAATYYDLVGAIKSGSPFNAGAALGVEVKLDNAAPDVVVVDPSLYVLNMIEDTLVETSRDVKNAKFIISAYLRAQGTLRKVKAAAYFGA